MTQSYNISLFCSPFHLFQCPSIFCPFQIPGGWCDFRGKSGAGECGIKSEASYPTVAGGGPSPPSPPSPPPPTKGHYGQPPCRGDEAPLSVLGKGSICTPDCNNGCPTDVPEGTTARPRCVDDDYCVLSCFWGGCPTGAKCIWEGGRGMCVYPDDGLEIAI